VRAHDCDLRTGAAHDRRDVAAVGCEADVSRKTTGRRGGEAHHYGLARAGAEAEGGAGDDRERRGRGGTPHEGAAAGVLDRECQIGEATHRHGAEVLRGGSDADLRGTRGSHAGYARRDVAAVGCEADVPRKSSGRRGAEAHHHGLARPGRGASYMGERAAAPKYWDAIVEEKVAAPLEETHLDLHGGGAVAVAR